MYGRVDQHVEAKAHTQRICVDVPCGRCASNLRGLSPKGQCPECGMENAKSLSMAAIRCEDPHVLEQVGLGLNVQAWGTVLAMLACVLGPWLSRPISYGTFAVVEIVALALIGWNVHHRCADARVRRSASRVQLYVVPLGGIALVTLAPLIRWQTTERVGPWLIAGFLAAALVWFVAQCHQLSYLEEVDSQMSMGAFAVQARRLRWGTGAAVLLLSLHCGVHVLGREVWGHDMVLASVSLVVLALLTTLLLGQSARRLSLEARVARLIREACQWPDPRLLPDEPNWMV